MDKENAGKMDKNRFRQSLLTGENQPMKAVALPRVQLDDFLLSKENLAVAGIAALGRYCIERSTSADFSLRILVVI